MTLDELKVLITADASQLRNEVKHLQGYIDTFGKESGKATEGLNVGFKKDTKSADKTAGSVDSVTKAINAMDAMSKAAFAAMVSSANATSTAIAGIEATSNAFGTAFSSQLIAIGRAADELGIAINAITPHLIDILETIMMIKNGGEGLSESQQATIDRLRSGVSGLGDTLKNLGQVAQDLSGETEEVAKNTSEEIKDNIKDVGDAAKKASDDIASATNKASSKSTEAGNKIKINWKSIAAGIGNAVKKVGQFVKQHNPISKMAKSLSKVFGRLKETILSAFVFSAVSSWFYSVKDTISGYLKTNQELQNNLGQLKGTLLTAFQPLLDIAIPAIEKLTASLVRAASAFASFTARITGTSVEANRKNAEAMYNQAKAYDATAKSADKAKKATMGFDELNIISSGKTGAADAEADTTSFDFPEVNEGELDLFKKFTDLFGKLPGFLDGLNPKIAALTQNFNDLVEKILNSDLADSFVKTFGALGRNLTTMIQNLNWTNLGKLLVGGLNTLIRAIDEFFTNVDWLGLGKGIMDSIMAIIENFDPSALMSAISTILESAIDLTLGLIYNLDFGSIFNFIWDTIQALLSELINGNLIPKLSELLGAAVGAIIKWVIQWTVAEIKAKIKQWKQIFGFFKEHIDAAGGDIGKGILNAIGDAFKNIGIWLYEKLIKPLVDGLLKGLGLEGGVGQFGQIAKKLWNDFVNGLKIGWEAVKNWFVKLWNSITTKVKELWKKFTDFLGKIKTTVVNIAVAIGNALKKPINAIIGGINKLISGVVSGINGMIKALNRLSFDVPDWVPGIGGKKFGFNIGLLSAPQIPYLAKGGIIEQPTMAMLGEQGKEAIIPLENNTEWIDKLADRLGQQTPSRIVLEVDGKELGWATIRNINSITKQTGGLPLVIA